MWHNYDTCVQKLKMNSQRRALIKGLNENACWRQTCLENLGQVTSGHVARQRTRCTHQEANLLLSFLILNKVFHAHIQDQKD